MKLIDSWCPKCISHILFRFYISLSRFWGNKKQKVFDNIYDFQEQQITIPNEKQKYARNQITINNLEKNLNDNTYQNFQVHNNVEQKLIDHFQDKILLSSKQQQINVQKENNNNHSVIQIPIKIKNTQILQQKKQKKKITTQSFKINLERNRYTQLLTLKTQNLQQKFNQQGIQCEIQKSLSSQLQIRIIQLQKMNVFIYSFKLKCNYSFYNNVLNDYVLQKSFNSNIDEYKLMDMISTNARINYLAYKKILIVSPRDFVYMKYSYNQINEYYDVAFSIPYQNFENKIRGQIILNASKIIQDKNEILIHVYSEVDMKLSVNPKYMKNQAINQIKKYVEKCEKYVNDYYITN